MGGGMVVMEGLPDGAEMPPGGYCCYQAEPVARYGHTDICMRMFIHTCKHVQARTQTSAPTRTHTTLTHTCRLHSLACEVQKVVVTVVAAAAVVVVVMRSDLMRGELTAEI
eukprot:3474622-Rhodomonas_salina.1